MQHPITQSSKQLININNKISQNVPVAVYSPNILQASHLTLQQIKQLFHIKQFQQKYIFKPFNYPQLLQQTIKCEYDQNKKKQFVRYSDSSQCNNNNDVNMNNNNNNNNNNKYNHTLKSIKNSQQKWNNHQNTQQKWNNHQHSQQKSKIKPTTSIIQYGNQENNLNNNMNISCNKKKIFDQKYNNSKTILRYKRKQSSTKKNKNIINSNINNINNNMNNMNNMNNNIINMNNTNNKMNNIIYDSKQKSTKFFLFKNNQSQQEGSKQTPKSFSKQLIPQQKQKSILGTTFVLNYTKYLTYQLKQSAFCLNNNVNSASSPQFLSFYQFSLLLFPQINKSIALNIDIMDTLFYPNNDKQIVYVFNCKKKGLIKIKNKNKICWELFIKRKNYYINHHKDTITNQKDNNNNNHQKVNNNHQKVNNNNNKVNNNKYHNGIKNKQNTIQLIQQTNLHNYDQQSNKYKQQQQQQLLYIQYQQSILEQSNNNNNQQKTYITSQQQYFNHKKQKQFSKVSLTCKSLYTQQRLKSIDENQIQQDNRIKGKSNKDKIKWGNTNKNNANINYNKNNKNNKNASNNNNNKSHQQQQQQQQQQRQQQQEFNSSRNIKITITHVNNCNSAHISSYFALLKYKDNTFTRIKQSQFKSIYLNPLYFNERYKNINNTQYIQALPYNNLNKDIKVINIHFHYDVLKDEKLFKYVKQNMFKQNQFMITNAANNYIDDVNHITNNITNNHHNNNNQHQHNHDNQNNNQNYTHLNRNINPTLQKQQSMHLRQSLKKINPQLYLYYLVFQIYTYISMHHNKRLLNGIFKFIQSSQNYYSLYDIQSIVVVNQGKQHNQFVRTEVLGKLNGSQKLQFIKQDGNFIQQFAFNRKQMKQRIIKQEKQKNKLLQKQKYIINNNNHNDKFKKLTYKLQTQTQPKQTLLQKQIKTLFSSQNQAIQCRMSQFLKQKLQNIYNLKDKQLSKNIFKILNPNVQNVDFHEILNNQKKLKKFIEKKKDNTYSRKDISNFTVIRTKQFMRNLKRESEFKQEKKDNQVSMNNIINNNTINNNNNNNKNSLKVTRPFSSITHKTCSPHHPYSSTKQTLFNKNITNNSRFSQFLKSKTHSSSKPFILQKFCCNKNNNKQNIMLNKKMVYEKYNNVNKNKFVLNGFKANKFMGRYSRQISLCEDIQGKQVYVKIFKANKFM